MADYNIILLLTLALLQALTLVILAGVVLTARSYTQLLGVIQELGSQVEAQLLAVRPAQTISLPETVSDAKSVLKDDTPTTPEQVP